jgi:Double-GTPase 2
MPAVIAIAAVVALGLYLWGCLLALQYIVVPAFPYLVVGGAASGVLLAAFVLGATLLGAGSFAPVTITFNDVTRSLPRKRNAITAHGRDAAWPNYLFAQSRTDLSAWLARVGDMVGTLWSATYTFVRDNIGVLFVWPLLLLPLIWAVVMTLSAAAGAIAIGVLVGAVLLAALAGWLVVALAARGVDHGIRKLRRARATCHYPACNHRSMIPAYQCQCGAIHHDIRAGRQGAVARRCRCDRLLPTTVLRASSAGLVAVCQRCDRPLHPGSAAMTDVALPVFGPTSAGKTRLVYAGMVALQRHLTAVGGTLLPVGADNESTFTAASKLVDLGRQTTKTPVDAPRAITVRIRTTRREALLHLYDAAGESFADRVHAVELAYLADTQGLIFVLDPFSIPRVVSELGADRGALEEARPAVLDPEQSYLITAQWLRDQGVALGRLPLAIAVVKADLLMELHSGSGLDRDADSDQVNGWLREKGLDNLLDGAERDFGTVRSFLVSSLDDINALDGRAVGTSPARPLIWLLERSGVPVAEQKEPVPS